MCFSRIAGREQGSWNGSLKLGLKIWILDVCYRKQAMKHQTSDIRLQISNIEYPKANQNPMVFARVPVPFNKSATGNCSMMALPLGDICAFLLENRRISRSKR